MGRIRLIMPNNKVKPTLLSGISSEHPLCSPEQFTGTQADIPFGPIFMGCHSGDADWPDAVPGSPTEVMDLQVVMKGDAERYWQIMPPTLPTNVIPMT